MEALPVIILLVLVILALPLILAIWLVASVNNTRNRVRELSIKVDRLEMELVQLRHAPKTAVEPEAPPAAAPVAEPPAPPIFPVRETPSPVPAEPIIPPEPLIPPQPIISPEPVREVVEPPPAPAAPRPISVPIAPQLPVIPPLPPPLPLPETATARETAEPAAPPEKASFEMRLGTFWLVRIGIVMLLTGLAFFANYAYHHIIGRLGPAGKTSLLYVASGLLLVAGAWWQRRAAKESLKNYAQVLFAGGLAAVYFTTYAAHHLPPLRIIESALLDGTLLLAWAGVILWFADRRKSEVMALFAVGLAFYSSVITRVGEFTLYSNLILTIAAVVFLVRNRWAGLSFASLGTTYAGYTFWRFLHDDGWHWATPGENLWLGAGFLASYWLVFTAATFLSKSPRLSGASRASFLTLNNGAFFALFLLTMLQVHSGGFWKFSLGYGAALLGLAGLSRWLLASEPLAKNAYLTEGLLLVTLGLVSKFSGLQLALVLGAESVVLFMLGSQRPGIVLKFFAYAAAFLATGWYVWSSKAFDASGVWIGAVLGLFMAANAVRAHWLEKDGASERLETTAFALVAFGDWGTLTWFNTFWPHLLVALVLGLESVVLYNLVARRRSSVPKIFAYIGAVLAVGWCIAHLGNFDRFGLSCAAVLGGMLIYNAWRAHRQALDDSRPLRPEPVAFTVFAFAAWLAATWFNTTRAQLPLALAAEAVVLTFSIYLLRIREVALLGQFFLVFGQLAWLLHFLAITPPWWNPLVIIVVTVGLSHWWQHQRTLEISRETFFCYSSVYALAVVAVGIAWLHPAVSPAAWLALASVLAVVMTGYGVVARAWPLAICGQIFLLAAGWEFLRQLFTAKPEWYFPLAPVATLAALSFATAGWFARRPGRAEVRGPLLQTALVYRWIALGMSLLWIWQYVPERQRIWAFMLAAAAVFATATWRARREGFLAAAIYAAASLAALWLQNGLAMDVYWPNLLSLLALFAMQQALRRMAASGAVEESVHGMIVFIAGISLWRFISCWMALLTTGFYVTMSWAGFAVVVFAAGMILRERFYRWFGLAVLAAAVGRVVLVDVWKQETIARVLTFMALGVALLVVGFIYNKYQEKIRQWL